MTHGVFPSSRVLAAATLAKQHRLNISTPANDPDMVRLSHLIGFATAALANGTNHQHVTLDIEDYIILHGFWPSKGRVTLHVASGSQKPRRLDTTPGARSAKRETTAYGG